MANESEEDIVHKKIAPLMEAIGHVAHHWSVLEYEINQMIWALAGLNPADGACITAQIASVLPRLRALIALADQHGASPELLQDLNKFSGRADAAARQRNRILHDPWFFREYQGKQFTVVEYGRLEVTADRRLAYAMKTQSRKEVLDVAHVIIAIRDEYRALRGRIHAELKEQLESRLGKSLEDFLRYPIPDSETKPPPPPPQPSRG